MSDPQPAPTFWDTVGPAREAAAAAFTRSRGATSEKALVSECSLI